VRYLVDTNLLSGLRRPNPDRKVVSWVLRNEPACALSAITIGEFTRGAFLLAAGRRRQAVIEWIAEVELQFEDKTLPVDSVVLKAWGELCGESERETGRRFQVLDSLIAATAIAHRLIVVTRNARDFPDAVPTIDPWV
jgi:predicted nucleic acid-binding protein